MEYTAYFGVVCEWLEAGTGIHKNGYIKTSKDVIEVFPDESKMDDINRIINNTDSRYLLNKDNILELVSVHDHRMHYVTRLYKRTISIPDSNLYYCTNQENAEEDLVLTCVGENVAGKNVQAKRKPVICKGTTKFNQLAHSLDGKPFYRNRVDVPGVHRIPATYTKDNYPLYVMEPRQAIYKDPAIDSLHTNRFEAGTDYVDSTVGNNFTGVNPDGSKDEETIDPSELVELSFVMPNVEIAVGDKIAVKLRTNVQNYEIVLLDKDMVRYHGKTKELEALKEGNTTVIARYSVRGKIIREAFMHISILSANGAKSNSIMLHNRNTNRLTTLKLGKSTEEDIIYNIPSGGSVITDNNFTYNPDSVLDKPTVLYPADGTVDFEGNIKISSFIGEKTTEKLIGTKWEFSLTSVFKEEDIILRREKFNLRYNNPYEMSSVFSLLTFYVRAKYCTKSYESAWSVPIKITTLNVGVDGLDTILNGDSWNGGYMGTIREEHCLDKYDFMGDWKIRHDTSSADSVRCYKTGMVVHHEGKLYRALRDMTNAEGSKFPTNDEDKWTTDFTEFNNKLPTYRWVNERIGIGMGLTDNNVDGLSSANKTLGGVNDESHKRNWFKFIYKGRIYYVPQTPFTAHNSNGVCWNDIAKREAVYGDRTVAMNGTIYRVGLPRADMWYACMGKMYTNDKGDNWFSMSPISDLHLDDGGFFEDFREGPVRAGYVYDGLDNFSKLADIDCKVRKYGWRPVLEYIAKGNEPYNNLPADDIKISVPPTNEADGIQLLDVGYKEKFIYDPHTDTGWFGMTNPPDSISCKDFWDKYSVKFSGYTRLNNKNAGYLKYYWHGKVLYMQSIVEITNISINDMRKAGFAHGIDMGGTDKQVVEYNGKNMIVCMPFYCNYTPFDFTTKGTSKDYMYNGYGMWYELIHRSCTYGSRYYYILTNSRQMQLGVNFDHPNKPLYDLYKLTSWSDRNGYEGHFREITTDRNKPYLCYGAWDSINDQTEGLVGTFKDTDDGWEFVLYDPLYHTLYNR